MVATLPSALLLFCFTSLVISSSHQLNPGQLPRNKRHFLSHFLDKFHPKEDQKEEEEEEVTEAPIVLDNRDVGFKVLDDCRTVVEEVEEVIYGEVKVRECRTSNETECHTEPVQQCEQRLVEQCKIEEQEECREEPQERCVTRWRVEEHEEQEREPGVQVSV